MERKRLEEAQEHSANDTGGVPRKSDNDAGNSKEEVNAHTSIEEHQNVFDSTRGDPDGASASSARKKRRLEAPRSQHMGHTSQVAEECSKKKAITTSKLRGENAEEMLVQRTLQSEDTARDEQPSSDFIDLIGGYEEDQAWKWPAAVQSVYNSASIDEEQHTRSHVSRQVPPSPVSSTGDDSGTAGTAANP